MAFIEFELSLRQTSVFWEEARAALQQAPELRAASRELRYSSLALRARNLKTNMIADSIQPLT